MFKTFNLKIKKKNTEWMPGCHIHRFVPKYNFESYMQINEDRSLIMGLREVHFAFECKDFLMCQSNTFSLRESPFYQLKACCRRVISKVLVVERDFLM